MKHLLITAIKYDSLIIRMEKIEFFWKLRRSGSKAFFGLNTTSNAENAAEQYEIHVGRLFNANLKLLAYLSK